MRSEDLNPSEDHPLESFTSPWSSPIKYVLSVVSNRLNPNVAPNRKYHVVAVRVVVWFQDYILQLFIFIFFIFYFYFLEKTFCTY